MGDTYVYCFLKMTNLYIPPLDFHCFFQVYFNCIIYNRIKNKSKNSCTFESRLACVMEKVLQKHIKFRLPFFTEFFTPLCHLHYILLLCHIYDVSSVDCNNSLHWTPIHSSIYNLKLIYFTFYWTSKTFTAMQIGMRAGN